MDPGAVVLRHGPDQTGSKGLVGRSHLWSPTGDSDLGPPEQGLRDLLATCPLDRWRPRGG